MASLNTFGAILSYAAEMESRLKVYYRGLGDEDLSRAAEKRQKRLERVRRENVLEITLEPIEGLEAADYAMDLGDVTERGQSAASRAASRFYREAAPKINVRAARRALERCGREHGNTVDA